MPTLKSHTSILVGTIEEPRKILWLSSIQKLSNLKKSMPEKYSADLLINPPVFATIN
jgi:hypothetical protein